MGVIYKLKPEIKEFIINTKQLNKDLSCRKISSLVSEKFQIIISKSAVNSIIKASGLSLPVGRRSKKDKEVLVTKGLGAIFLKVADYLLGGSYLIAQTIGNRFKVQTSEILAKTESVLYLPLFDNYAGPSKEADWGMWLLMNQRFSIESLNSYLNELQEVIPLSLDIYRIISSVSQYARLIKVNFSEDTALYLDAQLHTIWSTNQIPGDFSTAPYKIRSYINRVFQEGEPFILSMAPGYDKPTKEFFDFILNSDLSQGKPLEITLYGNKLEELEIIRLNQDKKYCFIFGLWPWQFGHYRKVIMGKEFQNFYFEPLKKNFYLAETEIELSQPDVSQIVTLRGCALKTDLNDKIRLIILTNLSQKEKSIEEIVSLYLSHWPNLEEGFQDFSRKVELFSYTTAKSQRFFSVDDLGVDKKSNQGVKALFDYYLKALDYYVRWHFLPLGYENKDFSTINEHFYSLGARLERQKNHTLLTFLPPCGYPFLKDLEYACRRVNEVGFINFDGKKLWCCLE